LNVHCPPWINLSLLYDSLVKILSLNITASFSYTLGTHKLASWRLCGNIQTLHIQQHSSKVLVLLFICMHRHTIHNIGQFTTIFKQCQQTKCTDQTWNIAQSKATTQLKQYIKLWACGLIIVIYPSSQYTQLMQCCL
jgi:hypothetical protein